MKDKASTRVAEAIRQRRERLGLTLRDLAAQSGVSSSMISDVERGAKSPTVATLAALSDALGIPVSALFDSPADRRRRIHVSRAGRRAETTDPDSKAHRAVYRPTPAGSRVELVRYKVPARTMAGPFAAHEPGTLEHMYLAAGSIRLEFGEDAADLETGDCCTCIADAPHAFDNKGSDAEAVIYIVVEHR